VHRRQFLRLTGGTAAAATLAAWSFPGCSRRVVGVDAGRAPRADPDRPLLLVLVPKDESEGWRRGNAIGGILNHGGDAVLADLAGVELVCATKDRLPPEARAVADGDPWFVLLTRDGEATTARGLTLEVPPAPPMFPREGQTWEQVNAEAQAEIDVRAAALHAFLAPAVAASGDVAARAAEARKRYVEKAPPGAHWANSEGCGTHVEGVRERSPMVACGMAMIPPVARRFLHFYVRG
jgi:hypothetical protein